METSRPSLIVALGSSGRSTLERLLAQLGTSNVKIRSTVLFDASTGRPADEPEAPQIYVVSSLCGGTGSGIIPTLLETVSRIDRETVAQMLRHPEQLYRMSPHAFELMVAEVYRGLGYSVRRTRRSRDGGVDIHLTKTVDGMSHRYVVQCKHSAKSHGRIGVRYVRELLGVVADYAAMAGILVTNVLFSRDAANFVERHADRLFSVDREALNCLMARYVAAKA